MEKVASKILETISDFASDNPMLTAGVLAGGGLGLVGGALAPGKSDDPNEDPNERVTRRVRNALLAGAAGAAGAGLIGYGANNMLQPIAEGSGLSANESIDLWAPLLAGGGAAGAAGMAEYRNKVKAAEDLVKDVYGKDKPFSGTTARAFLGNAMTDPDLRGTLETNIAKKLSLNNGTKQLKDVDKKVVHDLLERAGISTTAPEARMSFKDFSNLIKDKIKGVHGPLPQAASWKTQLRRLGRFAKRNKYTLGAGLGAAALSKWLLGNN